MISRYYLADHVYAAHFENGAVVLNLRTGRYLALGDPGARVLRSLTQEGIDCCALPANFADRCIQQGLLQTRPSDPSPFDPKGVCVAAPLSDIKPSPQQVRILPRYAALFLTQYLMAEWEIRHRSLLQIAERIQQKKMRKNLRSTTEAISTAVLQFRALRPWFFTADERCLLHALALSRFLMALGLNATWVIGVRLQPWAAHSWVQSGSLVLDGIPEQIREYKPIFAV